MMRRYTPFDEIDQFFGRMGRGFEFSAASGMAVDVANNEDAFVLTADLPGYDREEIELTVADSVVTISAEHHQADDTAADDDYLHRERRTTSMQRQLTLPEAVDDEQATAAYHNGVLTVTLPKQSAAVVEAGRRIDIE